MASLHRPTFVLALALSLSAATLSTGFAASVGGRGTGSGTGNGPGNSRTTDTNYPSDQDSCRGVTNCEPRKTKPHLDRNTRCSDIENAARRRECRRLHAH